MFVQEVENVHEKHPKETQPELQCLSAAYLDFVLSPFEEENTNEKFQRGVRQNNVTLLNSVGFRKELTTQNKVIEIEEGLKVVSSVNLKAASQTSNDDVHFEGIKENNQDTWNRNIVTNGNGQIRENDHNIDRLCPNEKSQNGEDDIDQVSGFKYTILTEV